MDFKLQPHASIAKPEGPLLVCVLDGWGERCPRGSLTLNLQGC